MTEKKIRPQERYDREHMQMVGAKYKKDFVQEFKNACKALNKPQSAIFRQAMEQTIREAEEARKAAESEK